jgi:hypothetical protein
MNKAIPLPVMLIMGIAILICGTGVAGAAILEEGFEGGAIPATWTVHNVDGGDEWEAYSGSYYAHTGSYSARIAYDSPNDDWLITPKLTPEAGSNTLSFWYRVYSSSNPETFNVKLSTTGTDVADFTVTLDTITTDSTTYLEYTKDLSSYEGDDIYIAVQCVSDYKYYLYVDDFSGIPLTPVPMTFKSLAVNQASTGFVSPATNDNMILRLDFEVEGDSGTLPLNSIEVEPQNIDNDDVTAVKLYRTNTTTFSTDNQLGGAETFASPANFSNLNYNLPEGMTYVWVTYDVACDATVGNTLDAKILAGKVNVNGSTYPASDENPVGSREIACIVEIGDGTATQYTVPFHGNYDYGWSKIIYTKSEIGAQITIDKIAFDVDKSAGYSYPVDDQRIYMAHTAVTSFPDESKPDPSTMTEVYNGSITWVNGWTVITLDTSFPYNNVDNLLIYYENRDGSYVGNQPIWNRTLTLPDYRSVYDYQDNSFPTGDGSQVRLIPNIQLYYTGVGAGLSVEKTVYNPKTDTWVDSINGAVPGETYRFRINVTATCCNFTDVVINDTLSPSLGYAGNPSPSAPTVIGNVYQWTFPTLNKCETKTIEFDATVSYRGYDCNLVNVTGWCNESLPHEQYSDEANACIDSRVDLAVKQVWHEHIRLNPACADLEFYRAIVNESNTIRVWVENNGPSNITAGEAFDVRFDLNGVQVVYTTLQGPLNAGEDEYYDIVWTPDCTGRPEWPNYPPMPDHPSTCISPGYRLNVTVDPSNTVNETDENNNLGWRTVSICNSGYKSKNFDCDPEDPLTSFEYYDDFYGGVVYNVSGV